MKLNKKQILGGLLSAAMVFQMATVGFTASAATSAELLTAKPLASVDGMEVTTEKKLLTNTEISDFTTEFDYTVKQDETASLLYDLEKNETSFWDFDDGQTAGMSLLYNGDLYTTDDKKLYICGGNWTQTTNLVENVTDFELSFVFSYWHPWTNAMVYMRDDKLELNLRGDGGAEWDDWNRIVLTDRNSGTTVKSKINPNDKLVRIVGKGNSVKVYVGGELAIDMTTCDETATHSGGIYFTSTECCWYMDNLSFTRFGRTNWSEEKDNFYRLNIGTNVSLDRICAGKTTSSTSETALTSGKNYHFTAVRKKGTLKLYADDDLILTANNDFPVVSNNKNVLWNGLLGLTATANCNIQNIKVYNSTSFEMENNLAILNPLQNGFPENFGINDQWSWSGEFERNAKVETNGNNASIVSPTATNSFVRTTNLLKEDAGDVYIRFKADKDRWNWTNDVYFFAGYQVKVAAEGDGIPCSATGPSGETIACNSTYRHYHGKRFVIEFIKTGNTVSVYYYPENTERTLLFTDSNCKSATANLYIETFQGSLGIYDFEVYDTTPKIVLNAGAMEYSAYIKNNNVIGNVPADTTVLEFKSNLVNESEAKVTFDGKELADDALIPNGAVVTYENLGITYTVETVAVTDYMYRSLMGNGILEKCKTVGRPVLIENEGVAFEWTASGITLSGDMQGDVRLVINRDDGWYAPEIGMNVVIDGDTANPKFVLFEENAGDNVYTVAQNLAPGQHTVYVAKNYESQTGSFILKAVQFNGTAVRPADSDRKIEFVGDSITGGCGIKVSTSEDPYHFSYYTYAAEASRLLGADYYGMANSGWGFASYLKGEYTMERVYEYATSVRTPNTAWDFSKWQPDVVVVNLGTNDNTVIEFNMNIEEFKVKDSYKNAVKNFVAKIRRNNPDAVIVWTYGAMGFGVTIDGEQTGEWIAEAIDEIHTTDPKVSFYRMHESKSGGGGHPDVIASRYLGLDLARYLCTVTDWSFDEMSAPEYNDNEVIADYNFDNSKEGFTANYDEYLVLTDGGMMIDGISSAAGYSGGNIQVRVSGMTGDDALRNYELFTEYRHCGPTEWGMDTLILRSPNGTTSNAIYLTVLGSQMTKSDNYFNPLKKEAKVQLVSTVEGVPYELGSTNDLDLLDGKNWKIHATLLNNKLNVTVWHADENEPAVPTFTADVSENAVANGDLYWQAHCSQFVVDNTKIIYKVTAGDLNDDGNIDIKDLIRLKKNFASQETLRTSADFDGDKSITSIDIILLRKYLLKIIDSPFKAS